MTTFVTEANLQDLLQISLSKPLLVYCYSKKQPNHAQDLAVLTQIETQSPDAIAIALLDCDEAPQLAMQFRLQQLPTFYLFQDGQMIDARLGEQSQANIEAFVAPYLPDENELAWQQGLAALEQEDLAKAIPLLQQAFTQLKDHHDRPRSDIALQLAKALLADHQLEAAKSILALIPIQDQEALYAALQAQIDLQEQAAHSPELQALEAQFKIDPENETLRIQLAIQWMQIGKTEEALALLFTPLTADLNRGDGEIKKALLEMLSALGTANPLANQYRRKLYSLIY